MNQPSVESRATGWASRIDWPLVGLFVLGAAVRIVAFGSVPAGLNQDEASSGYDAWSLLHYGIDHNGFHNPVVFVAWGSGMFALAAYITMPFIALLSLTTLAVRLPFLLAGLAGLLLFARLVKETDDVRTARIAAFLLAICPWHIMISRWALESNLFPTVFLAGITCAVIAVRRAWLLPVAFALFGISLYAYGTAYVVVPLFLLLATPYALYHRLWRPWPLVTSVAVLGLLAVPIALFVCINTLQWNSIETSYLSIPRLTGTPRYETVGNFRFWELAFFRGIASNLGQALWLLVIQRDEEISNSIPWFGLVYLFSTPFAIAGFCVLVRRCWQRAATTAYFLLAWCVAGMALAIFVTPNINRLNICWFPLLYCTALGILWTADRIYAEALPWTLSLYATAFVAFAYVYFVSFPRQAAVKYHPGLHDAIRAASANPADRVCMTGLILMPYIHVLFANQIDPHEFLETVQYLNPGEEFQLVQSFGRYEFGVKNDPDPRPDVYLLYDEPATFDDQLYKVQQFGAFRVVRLRDLGLNVDSGR